jgi:hypothetical protein
MKKNATFPWGIAKDMTYVPTADFRNQKARIAELEKVIREAAELMEMEGMYRAADRLRSVL